MIKPDAFNKMGDILDLITQNGFLITKLKMCNLSRNEAFDFYQEHQSKDFFGYVHLTEKERNVILKFSCQISMSVFEGKGDHREDIIL